MEDTEIAYDSLWQFGTMLPNGTSITDSYDRVWDSEYQTGAGSCPGDGCEGSLVVVNCQSRIHHGHSLPHNRRMPVCLGRASSGASSDAGELAGWALGTPLLTLWRQISAICDSAKIVNLQNHKTIFEDQNSPYVSYTGVHLDVSLYLTGVHLTGVHLTGVHLTGVHLTGVHLTGMHLTGHASHKHVSYRHDRRVPHLISVYLMACTS